MNAATKKRAQRAATTANDPRWADMAARNAEADGMFYYAVRTTVLLSRTGRTAQFGN